MQEKPLNNKSVLLLGTRGIPAAHGGFETFVDNLAPFLVENGWEVTVFCQEMGSGANWENIYKGVKLIHIPVNGQGTLSTIIFDWKSMRLAMRMHGLLFSFGYPTGAFSLFPRIFGRRHVINMDGIEWKRSQFGLLGRVAYYLNERLAAFFGNRLIADHPRIADHLSTRASPNKITTIAYGAAHVVTADASLLKQFNIEVDRYCIVIARPEPDNSILEIVEAFSRRRRNNYLIVLGNFTKSNAYHAKVLAAASEEVRFIGAIYEPNLLRALRKFAKFYVHGHKVGGTNPSLVEALGAGSAVLAHDNHFNKWVADNAALYFSDLAELDQSITRFFSDDLLLKTLRENAQRRFKEQFTWPDILAQYEKMLQTEIDLM